MVDDELVYIVIINWYGVDDTIECLQSLSKINYKNFKVVIVDNNSDDYNISKLKELRYDFLDKIFFNKNNLGFSGGNNVGIKYALSKNANYILLLNNDTIVDPDFLNELISVGEKEEKIGIIGPLICYYDDRDKIWSANGSVSKLKASGFTKHKNNIIDGNDKVIECSFLSGCCLLIKKKVFEDVGLLDEEYFLYLEDTDYCFRTIKQNYKIVFNSKSKIYHKVSVSTGKKSRLIPLYYSIRNRLLFIKKNEPYYLPISFTYLVVVNLIKIIFNHKLNKSAIKIIYLAFKDFFKSKFGYKEL